MHYTVLTLLDFVAQILCLSLPLANFISEYGVAFLGMI